MVAWLLRLAGCSLVSRQASRPARGYRLPILYRPGGGGRPAIGQHIIIKTVMAAINHRRFSPLASSFLSSRGRGRNRGSAHGSTMNTDEKSAESIG